MKFKGVVVQRLNFLWGFIVFSVVTGSLFLINQMNDTGDLTRAEIVQILNANKLKLHYPSFGELVTIARPSQKLKYSWSEIQSEKIDTDDLEYLVRVFSPTGELLVDETTDELSVSLRNLSAEGEYLWEVYPKYNGVVGNSSTATFKIAHPDLPFVGSIETPRNLLGVFQPNGDILFENGQPFYEITWRDQKTSPDEKYLIEIYEN